MYQQLTPTRTRPKGARKHQGSGEWKQVGGKEEAGKDLGLRAGVVEDAGSVGEGTRGSWVLGMKELVRMEWVGKVG